MKLILYFILVFQLNSQVSKFILQADKEALENFDNQKALFNLEEAKKLEANNPEILWRLSRTFVDIGEHLPTSNDIQKNNQFNYYQKALSFAEKAIENSKNDKLILSESLTRRAIANGRVALFKGVWESLDLIKKVKSDCEEAINLNKNNATAYYVLARTHAKICEKPKIVRFPLGLGWANLNDAIKFYKKSIENRQNFIMYRLDFAKTLIELEDFANAKAQLNKIQILPTEDEDDNKFRQEAKELLEKIK